MASPTKKDTTRAFSPGKWGYQHGREDERLEQLIITHPQQRGIIFQDDNRSNPGNVFTRQAYAWKESTVDKSLLALPIGELIPEETVSEIVKGRTKPWMAADYHGQVMCDYEAFVVVIKKSNTGHDYFVLAHKKYGLCQTLPLSSLTQRQISARLVFYHEFALPRGTSNSLSRTACEQEWKRKAAAHLDEAIKRLDDRVEQVGDQKADSDTVGEAVVVKDQQNPAQISRGENQSCPADTTSGYEQRVADPEKRDLEAAVEAEQDIIELQNNKDMVQKAIDSTLKVIHRADNRRGVLEILNRQEPVSALSVLSLETANLTIQNGIQALLETCQVEVKQLRAPDGAQTESTLASVSDATKNGQAAVTGCTDGNTRKHKDVQRDELGDGNAQKKQKLAQ